MGTIDESGSVLLEITTSVLYSSFIANRMAGATITTGFCIVSIDFALHSHMTFQLIKEYNKEKENDSKNGNKTMIVKVTNLIVAELKDVLIEYVINEIDPTLNYLSTSEAISGDNQLKTSITFSVQWVFCMRLIQ